MLLAGKNRWEISSLTTCNQQQRIFISPYIRLQSHIMASRWSELVNRTKTSSNISEITAAELKSHISGQQPSTSETAPVIIDVRESNELELGKVRGERNRVQANAVMVFMRTLVPVDPSCHFYPKRYTRTSYWEGCEYRFQPTYCSLLCWWIA